MPRNRMMPPGRQPHSPGPPLECRRQVGAGQLLSCVIRAISVELKVKEGTELEERLEALGQREDRGATEGEPRGRDGREGAEWGRLLVYL